MSQSPFKVASIGIGWWSDVLADAAGRTDGQVEIVSCFTRSDDKRQAFAEKYSCRAASSLDKLLADPELDASFLEQAGAAGLLTLKGHRSVGGMRASIYNAVPEEAVEALIAFMQDFERRCA